jgi:hypothetical protein
MDGASARPGNLIAQRGLRRSTIEAMCRGRDAWVAIAIDDDASVVGGTSSAIDALQDDMEGAGAQITCLRVGVASHTPLLASAVDPFRKVLAESTLRAPAVPVMAGIDAAPVTTRDRAIETLAAQLARTIEWARCLDVLFERGCRVFLELGPGRALSRTGRRSSPRYSGTIDRGVRRSEYDRGMGATRSSVGMPMPSDQVAGWIAIALLSLLAGCASLCGPQLFAWSLFPHCPYRAITRSRWCPPQKIDPSDLDGSRNVTGVA